MKSADRRKPYICTRYGPEFNLVRHTRQHAAMLVACRFADQTRDEFRALPCSRVSGDEIRIHKDRLRCIWKCKRAKYRKCHRRHTPQLTAPPSVMRHQSYSEQESTTLATTRDEDALRKPNLPWSCLRQLRMRWVQEF